MALKIKLTKSAAGASDSHRRTLEGLGLWRFNQERMLKDTPSNRGMVSKVAHLVSLDDAREPEVADLDGPAP